MFLPAVADLPQACIRLGDGAVAESGEVGDELFLIFGPQIVEAVVGEDRGQREDQFAIDIVLDMFGGLIVIAHRRASAEAGPVPVFGFRQREILAECIHGRESLPRMFMRIGDVEQELEKPFHLFEVSEVVEGGQGKIGVAQPAVPIVPIPWAARFFREAGR